MKFRIVVTDVTIYGSLRCVAGWDVDRKAMVRPEPSPRGFWQAITCGVNTTFHPGHLVEFQGKKPTTEPPHVREDVVVLGQPHRLGALTRQQFKDALRQSLVASPQAVFGPCLEFSGQKAHVLPGSDCGSLACMELPCVKFRLHVNRYKKPKLQAMFSLFGKQLDLSVAAKDFKKTFENDGLQATESLIAGARGLHLRLGLARPFAPGGGKPLCYLQINGIHPIF
jgi:hypothetical protein